jgi:hypothetical protein
MSFFASFGLAPVPATTNAPKPSDGAESSASRGVRQISARVETVTAPNGARFVNVVAQLSTTNRMGESRNFYLTIRPSEIDDLVEALTSVRQQALEAVEEEERNALDAFSDGPRLSQLPPRTGKTARDRESATRGTNPTNVPTVSQSMKGKNVGKSNPYGNGKGKGKK